MQDDRTYAAIGWGSGQGGEYVYLRIVDRSGTVGWLGWVAPRAGLAWHREAETCALLGGTAHAGMLVI